MNLLAIDTATEACSAALCLGDKTDGIFELCPQQQSQRILPMVDELLKRNNVSLNAFDALAYGRGPGSFTGVRIASSTIQGLALGADLPVLQISTLAAMAQENFERFEQSVSLALIDARMSEVYKGGFEIRDGVACVRDDEKVLPPSMVLEVLSDYSNEAQYVGTGFHAYAQDLGLKLHSEQLAVNYPNARYMLKLAIAQYKAKQAVSVDQVAPVYLRDKVTWKKLPGKE